MKIIDCEELKKILDNILAVLEKKTDPTEYVNSLEAYKILEGDTGFHITQCHPCFMSVNEFLNKAMRQMLLLKLKVEGKN